MAAVRLSECVVLTQHQYKRDFFGETNYALEPTVKMIDLNKQGIEEAIKNGATFRFWAKMSNFTMDEDLKKEAKRFGSLAFSGDSDGMLLFPNTYSDIHQYDNKPFTVDDHSIRSFQKGENESSKQSTRANLLMPFASQICRRHSWLRKMLKTAVLDQPHPHQNQLRKREERALILMQAVLGSSIA